MLPYSHLILPTFKPRCRQIWTLFKSQFVKQWAQWIKGAAFEQTVTTPNSYTLYLDLVTGEGEWVIVDLELDDHPRLLKKFPKLLPTDLSNFTADHVLASDARRPLLYFFLLMFSTYASHQDWHAAVYAVADALEAAFEPVQEQNYNVTVSSTTKYRNGRSPEDVVIRIRTPQNSPLSALDSQVLLDVASRARWRVGEWPPDPCSSSRKLADPLNSQLPSVDRSHPAYNRIQSEPELQSRQAWRRHFRLCRSEHDRATSLFRRR